MTLQKIFDFTAKGTLPAGSVALLPCSDLSISISQLISLVFLIVA